ncbi:Uncharacterised protein [Mycobacterium tuberculosis]|uniref:Uncharacterized protein n=1 Tax=Mycobacterium tuberculosis TaxID=1773 RepID=A0A0T7PI41_MYCTX|nr:Uncharacterised protein [Mycobacterium tuberculosis]CEZ29660.1 Uncharacterised protein [Mycobacterium tuberculosis]CEZ33725.1 Uncharacterised protein [Mycobacterium tuberculosis]CEZ37730.1 Uncharacterised protein [Mycobacterium tuberculosis]CEZ54409.1 Uncharacterised protein [Mycobacterium tuberculosis]
MVAARTHISTYSASLIAMGMVLMPKKLVATNTASLIWLAASST